MAKKAVQTPGPKALKKGATKPIKDILKPNQKKKRGGARPGAGRKKGSMEPHTLAAMKAKERFIRRVSNNVDKLFDAQFAKAVGESFLMRKVTERGPKGGIVREYHEIVTDPKVIQQYLDGEEKGGVPIHDSENYYYITTRSADNSAIADMLNRGLGKPTDVIEADVTSGGERLISVNESQLTQLIRARAERSDT